MTDSVESSRPLLASQKSGRHFSANTLVQLLGRIYEQAGVDGARVLQHLAGHSSLAITQRYIEVNDAQLHQAANLM